MNRTAYLVAHFEIVGGEPVFIGTGVYSSGAQRLTCGIGRERFAADVIQADGDTYEDALSHMRRLRDEPTIQTVFSWAFDALPKSGMRAL